MTSIKDIEAMVGTDDIKHLLDYNLDEDDFIVHDNQVYNNFRHFSSNGTPKVSFEVNGVRVVADSFNLGYLVEIKGTDKAYWKLASEAEFIGWENAKRRYIDLVHKVKLNCVVIHTYFA